MKATFISKDQNWQDGTTTYWFTLDGVDYGSNREFSSETFGIVDNAGELVVVDSESMPVLNEVVVSVVKRECRLTDEIVKSK